ncbi:DUF2267 domain-containing protein [Pseudonocardia sp. H11422]|uniref:DUF2267 domain-containing protein n=1 Tax=Pseudonocardia sp. H11422 TaxID=2835866 RepID=UPI001BDBFC1B|nr:DUF2267 domain-containing protein [Pseudonocardia sp. H11422]
MLYYPEFSKTVERVAGVPAEEAEPAACLTLQMLARRISEGEAADLAEHLPARLRRCLAYEGPQEKFGLQDFLHRIGQHLNTDRPTAERVAVGVFAALLQAVGRKEFHDMRSQLPRDFQPLLDQAVAAAPAPPVDDEHPPARFSLPEFLDRIVRRGVEPDRAQHAAEAVLEILALRITGGEVDDLIPLVPRELRPALRRGMKLGGGRGMRMPLEDFLVEIAKREHVDYDVALQHARAVLATLHESIGDKEFADLVAQLPNEYRWMLLEEYA